ncbi:MAG: SsrA-binding protein [Coxiella sp. DG_40]|nr:MAG: SsrA-binding protein [Coxiella sp. DG_40]
MGKSAKSKQDSNVIAVNRRARHDYQIESTLEAGLVLKGWEIKSLRAGRAQLAESYVTVKGGEAWLIGAHISPLNTVSTHITPDPSRTRKLLLHRKELDRIIGAIKRKGYTIVPLNLHWKKGVAKLEIAFAKGKKLYDKRQAEKRREWERRKQKLLAK